MRAGTLTKDLCESCTWVDFGVSALRKVPPMAICQSCQRECATRRVTLMQNIGFVIARSSKTFTGELCRDCGLRMAKEYTLITAFFGWWGVISFVLTPIFLIGNI